MIDPTSAPYLHEATSRITTKFSPECDASSLQECPLHFVRFISLWYEFIQLGGYLRGNVVIELSFLSKQRKRQHLETSFELLPSILSLLNFNQNAFGFIMN